MKTIYYHHFIDTIIKRRKSVASCPHRKNGIANNNNNHNNNNGVPFEKRLNEILTMESLSPKYRRYSVPSKLNHKHMQQGGKSPPISNPPSRPLSCVSE